MKRWVVLLLWPFYSFANAGDNPLAYLNSTRWQGNASIQYRDGSRESARCVATYFVNGSALKQNLRCATASVKISVRAQLAVQSPAIRGTFIEESYNIQGHINGKILADGFDLSIASQQLTGSLRVKTVKCEQDVVLVAPGSALAKIAIRMRGC